MYDVIHLALNLEPLTDAEYLALYADFPNILSNNQKGSLNAHYGKKHTEETKKLLSKLAKNRTSPMKGKKHSEETILKLKMKAAGRVSPMKGKQAWNKNKPLSEETKRKISNSKIGTIRSIETKNKISESSKKKKKIICEFCTKNVDTSNYYRWHGNRCKNAALL